MAKVIGRILSLGFPLPGVQVDNYTVLSAPSFFDYDAVVLDPRAAGLLVEGVLDGSLSARTFSDHPVVLHPDAANDVALGDVLRRRQDETRRLLDNGGIVVVFAHPAAMHEVPGAGSLDDYCWLPSGEGLDLTPPLLVAAEGSQAHVADWAHPTAAFVSSQLANIGYRAHFDVRHVEGAAVFAQSHGGAAIGVELPLGRGRLMFLPALRAWPSGEGRYTASEALQAGIRRALGAEAAGRPPLWVAKCAVPGLDQRAQALSEAHAAAAGAQSALKAAQADEEALARYQRLLWQEGTVGLNAVVLDALRFIGFGVYDSNPNELELTLGDERALIEIEGSEYPIEMAAHHRLRQRIERAIERRGMAPRGVLFVNGQRLLAPEARQHVSDSLRIASETMRYCVAPTTLLFEAVVAQLEGDDESVATFRQRLLAHDGLLS